MSDCIFCKIVKGEIPSYKIYEDDFTLAFLDIAPVSKGHALVIPKAHHKNLEDIPEELLWKLMSAVKKVGGLMKDTMAVEGYNVSENNDPVAGQIIPHIHFHVIPRNQADGLKLWPQGEYAAGEAEAIIKKINT